MNQDGLPEEVAAIMEKEGVPLLRAWRLYRGFTPEYVAELLYVTPRRFLAWESRFSPCQSTLLKLSIIYECSVAELTDE